MVHKDDSGEPHTPGWRIQTRSNQEQYCSMELLSFQTPRVWSVDQDKRSHPAACNKLKFIIK